MPRALRTPPFRRPFAFQGACAPGAACSSLARAASVLARSRPLLGGPNAEGACALDAVLPLQSPLSSPNSMRYHRVRGEERRVQTLLRVSRGRRRSRHLGRGTVAGATATATVRRARSASACCSRARKRGVQARERWNRFFPTVRRRANVSLMTSRRSWRLLSQLARGWGRGRENTLALVAP